MFQETMKDKIDEVRGMRRDDILAALGLARRRSLQNDWLPAVGLFAAGIAVGTGVALLLAPKTGSDMRRDIRSRANDLTRRVSGATREDSPWRHGGSGRGRDRQRASAKPRDGEWRARLEARRAASRHDEVNHFRATGEKTAEGR